MIGGTPKAIGLNKNGQILYSQAKIIGGQKNMQPDEQLMNYYKK